MELHYIILKLNLTIWDYSTCKINRILPIRDSLGNSYYGSKDSLIIEILILQVFQMPVKMQYEHFLSFIEKKKLYEFVIYVFFDNQNFRAVADEITALPLLISCIIVQCNTVVLSLNEANANNFFSEDLVDSVEVCLSTYN